MSETNKIIEEIKQIKEQYQAEVGSERKAWPNAIKDRVSKLYRPWYERQGHICGH